MFAAIVSSIVLSRALRFVIGGWIYNMIVIGFKLIQDILFYVMRWRVKEGVVYMREIIQNPIETLVCQKLPKVKTL